MSTQPEIILVPGETLDLQQTDIITVPSEIITIEETGDVLLVPVAAVKGDLDQPVPTTGMRWQIVVGGQLKTITVTIVYQNGAYRFKLGAPQ